MINEKELVELLRQMAFQRLCDRDCYEIDDDWIQEEMNNILTENNHGKK